MLLIYCVSQKSDGDVHYFQRLHQTGFLVGIHAVASSRALFLPNVEGILPVTNVEFRSDFKCSRAFYLKLHVSFLCTLNVSRFLAVSTSNIYLSDFGDSFFFFCLLSEIILMETFIIA